MIRALQKSLRWVVPCAWLVSPSPLLAVDEETAKTISDLKTQVQALMDEVKKLKDQVAKGDPAPARLNPGTPDEKAAAAPGQFDPVPSEAMQPTMELPEGGTSEPAPKLEQEGDKRLPMVDVSERGLIFRSKDNAHSIRLGGSPSTG